MPVVAAKGRPAADEVPYNPYGAAREILYDKSDEVMLSGPAGTGKSRANLEKMFLIAEKYPRSRQLIIRKTRESITESTLVTWEEKVVPPGHPCLTKIQRRNRQKYIFPNGSEIVIGGMDKPTRIMSTEYDVIYVAEALELTEEEWEALTTRLRNGKVPYQQMIGDTNPDGPRHWIKQREARKVLKLLESRHEHNPALWDMHHNRPTEFGAKYIARLENLTGVRYKRLRLGLWVAAEGLVYDTWDPHRHLLYRGTGDEKEDRKIEGLGSRVIIVRLPNGKLVKIGPDNPRYWVVDFGFRNPFVWQEWVADDDGNLYRIREIYQTNRLVEDLAKDILACTKDCPRPRAIICDHDAEDRATLERHLGMETIGAYKNVSAGIQAVASGLGTAESVPSIYFVRDALQHPRDENLVEKKKPTCTEEEISDYAWDESAGRKRGEEPVKENDHGCDAARYLVAYVRNIRSNSLDTGDWTVY